MLDILPALSSKGAAYVAGHHPKVMRRLPENAASKNVPHSMRILNVRVKRVSALFGVIVTYCSTRFHVLRMDACYDVSPPYDMAPVSNARSVCARFPTSNTCDTLSGHSSQTAGADGAIARSLTVTAGMDTYFTSINSIAPLAWSRDSATTIATGSPT